ncbi:MAG: Quinolinate phosphoribosyl transferase protein, partial [Chloroflexi bacterium]|nr:Quinolinate phosphoribosyl transferase protein [Chloroflexota bacterium]
MSIFDGQRLPSAVFKLDTERLPSGWYSDKYFLNIALLLRDLAAIGYTFEGNGAPMDIDLASIHTGEIEVEMQWFTRREPFSVIAGVDEALAILRENTGYYDDGVFVNTFDRMQVEAVQDGSILPYAGDQAHVSPVIRVRGRYSDFAVLETPTLGALTEATRVATNVYNVLGAANGKDVQFFPARFAHYKLQALHGYAYSLGVKAYNEAMGGHSNMFISTDEQGSWWGGLGGGTVAHAAIASFLGDMAEAMVQFARHRPVEIPRIALVDFHNDCVGDTLKVMRRMFALYRAEIDAGRPVEARRYMLFGVRADTSGALRDASVAPLGDPKLDLGVTPRLVHILRDAINAAWKDWQLTESWCDRAREWCQRVKIVVSGGFDPDKIRRFEQLKVPVDIYGVGTSLLSNCTHCGTNNDFTADVVRVKLDGRWVDMAKVGRHPGSNPKLETVSPEN